MKTINTFIKKFIAALIIGCISLVNVGLSYAAGASFSVSPMNQRIVLSPGETYRGSFKVVNPETNTANFPYVAKVEPFYVDNDYNPIYENNGDYNQIVDWITIENDKGLIAPNNVEEIYFTVNVPSNAAAGGQYAAITVTSDNPEATVEGNLNINAKYSIAHIIYAEVAGTTVRTGDIQETSMPSFVSSGNITASSVIKNTGNVHGTATYTMQVFPLFSNEEIYTTEENPETMTILPNRTLYHESVWYNTPAAGIFNVVYKVKYEGLETEISKMVIVCPIWLMILILAVILAIIIWIVVAVKKHGKKAKED